MSAAIPNALTIAGSDSGGGAGIQADLKAFSANGVYGASVITALTSQNTRTVNGIFDVDPSFVRQQIETVFADIRIDAVKIGMLSRPDVIAAVADGLSPHPTTPVVLDPVMVAKSGDKLLGDDAIGALRDRLLPMAAVLTPNLPEAGVLLDREAPADRAGMEQAGHDLLRMGPKAVLLKGGHLTGSDLVDLLVTGNGLTVLETTRVETRNTHGTGCTLSAALAAHLAKGCDMATATSRAQAYLHQAIRHADMLSVGSGHGPVHHFHNLWPAL